MLTLALALLLEIKPPVGFLNAGPKPKLMLVGTFHFADAGLDSYRPKYDVNIMEEKRQKELADLIEHLARFAPTKIAIEARAEDMERLNGRYQDYLAGKYELKPNEIYQVGFRLAKRVGLKRLYGIDVKGRMYHTDEEWKAEKAKFALPDSSPWDERSKKLYEDEDELKTTVSLLEYYRYINSAERLRIGHGHYLTGIFHAARDGDYFGPDNLSGWWYDRNLRIFDNIYKVIDSPNDRVLVLIGAGHVPILMHAAQSSPEVEWVDVRSVLSPGS